MASILCIQVLLRYTCLAMKEHISTAMDLAQHGKIEVRSKYTLDAETLPLAYTPGVAEVSRKISEDLNYAKSHSIIGNTILIISDGSAVLGLGNIGPEAAMPVMEGKAMLLQEFAGVNAFPLVLGTQDTEAIIQTIQHLAPSVSGINLEDISAPRCFVIEERLKEILDIPVFHDDQHGTAIVILAGLINAAKVVGKELRDMSVVIAGSGAAGSATARLLHAFGMHHIILLDSKGILGPHRDDLNDAKQSLLAFTNPEKRRGGLHEALQDADIFIGVSQGNTLDTEDIQNMNNKPIIFAMSNPTPEIDPSLAQQAGAAVVATGRSDFPNQINNALVFPGLFRGLLDARARDISTKDMIAIAENLAALITNPHEHEIIPSIFDPRVVPAVAEVFTRK